MFNQGFRKTVLASTAALAVLAGGIAADQIGGGALGVVSVASAQSGNGQGQGQRMQGSGQGQQGTGQGGQGGQHGQGGQGGVPSAAEAEEGGPTSSDRPDWAGKDAEGEKPSGMGGGQPDKAASGMMKGGLYGDLVDIQWLPSGTPDEDENDNLKVVAYVDTDGDGKADMLLSEYLSSEATYLIEWSQDAEGDWELTSTAVNTADPNDVQSSVEGQYTIVPGEVEFGRTSVARSPDSVFQRQIDEFEKTVDGNVDDLLIGVDGRILLQNDDGTVTTFDSPLVNLALYAVLMDTSREIELDAALLSKLESIADPAALLAASADKFGTISEDYVAYLNTSLGINEVTVDMSETPPATSVTYLDFTTSSYTTRTSVFTQDVVDTVFAGENVLNLTGIDAFAQLADDYLQVIEYIHENPDVQF